MPNTVPCPAPADVRRLVERGGTADEIDALARHVERCDACGRAVDALLAADPTAASLLAGRGTVLPEGAVVDRLMARLRDLQPAADAAARRDDTVAAAARETLSSAGSVDDRTEAPVDYLAPAQQPDELGRLGPYRVLKRLGAGGMGVVFLAEDTHLQRKVALKTMHPSFAANPQARERFLREARAAAAVEHEHVVAIHQVGEDRGVPYLAMPVLKGVSLDDRIRATGPLPLADAVRVAAEMADGLAAAHAQGLIHRDVKPGNVWLEGDKGKVKLLDFGLARAEADDARLTTSGAIVGTPAFMAPEQARGDPLDPRADLFGLGAVLYLMLTGKRPFRGDTTMSVLMALATEDPPAPKAVRPEVPAKLSDLTMRLLAKDRAARPASAQEVSRDLRALFRSKAAAPPPPAPPPSGPRLVPVGPVVDAEVVAPPPPPRAAASEPEFTLHPPARNARRAKPKPQPAGGPPRRDRRVWVAVGVLLFGGLLAAAAGVFLKLQTANGELVLEAADDDIEVTVKQAGKEPVVVVVDKQSKRTVELKAAGGEIEAKELPNGLRFKTQKFELDRGDTKVFTASMLLAPAPGKPADPPRKPADSPPAVVQKPAADGWLDLIPAVDVAKDVDPSLETNKNKWVVKDNALTYISDGHAGKLKFPVEMSGRYYEVTGEVTDHGDERVGLRFDLPASWGSIDLGTTPDGTKLGSLPLTDGVRLAKGRRTPFSIRILKAPDDSKDGVHATVTVGGKTLFDYTGHVRQIVHPYERTGLDGRSFGVWVYGSSATFHNVRLRMLEGGTAKIAHNLPDNWVELVPAVDPAKDAMPVNPPGRNEWVHRDNALSFVPDGKPGKLKLPVEIEGDRYEMKAVVSSDDDSPRFVFDLPTPKGTVIVIVGNDGTSLGDGKVPGKAAAFTNGRRHLIYFRMVKSPKGTEVKVSVDGKAVIEWSGNIEQILSKFDFSKLDARSMGVFTPGRAVTFHNLRVQMFDGGTAKLTRGTAPETSAADPAAVPIEERPADPKAAKIVLVPGRHRAGPGEHQFFLGAGVLRKLLSQTPGVATVVTEGSWPTKPETFAGAKAVVFVGGDEDPSARLYRDKAADFQKLADAGVGLVLVHNLPGGHQDLSDRAREWYGASYEPGGRTWSPYGADGRFDAFPDHPTTRGVRPFRLQDNWGVRFRFAPGAKGVTPILRVNNERNPVKLDDGTEDIAAWAFERPGGGRSFVNSGAHFHRSYGDENFRRLVVNGILWAAGVEVPKDGAKVDLDPADLNRPWKPAPAAP